MLLFVYGARIIVKTISVTELKKSCVKIRLCCFLGFAWFSLLVWEESTWGNKKMLLLNAPAQCNSSAVPLELFQQPYEALKTRCFLWLLAKFWKGGSRNKANCILSKRAWHQGSCGTWADLAMFYLCVFCLSFFGRKKAMQGVNINMPAICFWGRCCFLLDTLALKY